MVASIGGSSGLDAMKLLMAEFQKKVKSADTNGKAGLSKDEISSLGTGDNQVGSKFLSMLTKNFDKIDNDGDGELSQDEITAAKPVHGKHMGPPPGMMLGGAQGTDSSTSSASFDPLDTNKDGKISLEEMMAGIKSSLLGQAGSDDSSEASGLLKSSGSNYMMKLLSNYQDNSNESTSTLDLAV